MKRLAIALLLMSAAGPIAAKAKPPPKAAASEKPIDAAFHAAFGSPSGATLKKQGQLKEDIKYTPGDLVQTPFATVLLAPGEVVKAAHVNSGKLAVVYLKPSEKGFEVVKKFVPAVEAGSFGKIGEYSVSRSFGDLPVVSVEGGGTWQGCTVSDTTLLELSPDGPKELVTIPMTYDNSGVGQGKIVQISGRIDNIQPKKSFDVVYFGGSKEFKDRYVRKGDAYVLAAGGKSKMQTC